MASNKTDNFNYNENILNVLRCITKDAKTSMNLLSEDEKEKISNAKGFCYNNGSTIEEIMENSKVSESSVRRSIKILLEKGLVAESRKIKQSKSYHITEEGIVFLKEITIPSFAKLANRSNNNNVMDNLDERRKNLYNEK